MRIAYSNQIDALSSAEIVPSTEVTLYEAVNVQRQRLTTQWNTSSDTDQSIVFNAGGTVTEGEARQPMFQATTNLMSDLNISSWTLSNAAVTTVDSILGEAAYNVRSTSGQAFATSDDMTTTSSQQSVVMVIRKGNVDAGAQLTLNNASTASNIANVKITFSTKTIAYVDGAASFDPEWIDDDTVRVFITPDGASVGNVLKMRTFADFNNATGSESVYSAPIVVDNEYPLAFTATTRAAWASSVTHRMPPSGKFIIDCAFFPYFPYTTAINQAVASWYVSGTQRFRVVFSPTADTYTLVWQDGGTTRTMDSAQYDDGSSFRKLNQQARIVASLDISTAGVTTGSRLFVMAADGSYFGEDDTSWSGAIDGLSTTFPTLEIGEYINANELDGLMSYFRIYGGTLENTITTEAALDAELATKQLTYENEFQGKFTANTVAIMGHNISAEADIKVQLNDFDEWNYTDGSGSSIIEQTLTWYENTPILYFFSERYKRQYAKFSINDPNNDDAAIKIGRMWVGEYVTIDPSSLYNFKVTKKRSDRNIYGINRQKWSDEGVGWRRFELQFPLTATTTLNIIQTMYDTVGTYSSLIFANFDTIRSFTIVEPVYCSIEGDIDFTHRQYAKYEYALSLEEDR